MSLHSSRFAAALLALSAAAMPAWAANNSLEPVGWSKDEQRVAVRIFEYDYGEYGSEERPDCDGYLDHKGKPFEGALRLEVYEKGRKVAAFPIQDWPKCTAPKTARARLNKAKAEMSKLGIDLTSKQPGTVLTPKPLPGDVVGVTVTVTEGPGAPYTLETRNEGTVELIRDPSMPAPAAGEEENREEVDFNSEHREKGELVVYVNKDGKQRKLAGKKYEYSYVPALGDMLEVKLAEVWVSPTGKSVVFISEYIAGTMRGRTDELEVMGGASWDGAPLVLR